MVDQSGWTEWPRTRAVLMESYHLTGMSSYDSQYYLAGLQRYVMAWTSEHAARQVPLWVLDQAAAGEVAYQWTRGRTFRRPCAALSACWTNLVTDRPERILQRWERAQVVAAAKIRSAASPNRRPDLQHG